MNTIINFGVKMLASIFHIKIDTAKTKTFATGIVAIGGGLVLVGMLWNQGDRNIMDYKEAFAAILGGIGLISGRDAITKLAENLSGKTALKASVISTSPILQAAEGIKNIKVTYETREIANPNRLQSKENSNG